MTGSNKISLISLLASVLISLSVLLPETSASPAITFLENSDDFYLLENASNSTRFKRQASTACPQKTQWRCRDGQCISRLNLCDGLIECADGSDESFAACRNFRCKSHLYRCTYGACADGDAKCNGIQDCADNSDELHKDCRTTPIVNTCQNPNDFQCADKSCIKSQFLCDGVDQCPDKSDETVAQCTHFKCKSHLFKCAYGACVDGDAQCNNVKDCSDGSDEDPALCYTSPNWKPIPTTPRPTTAAPVVTQPPLTSGCLMPPPPENGKYLIWGKPPTIPPGGIAAPYTLLEYSCSKNYALDKNSAAYCAEDNTWSGLPNCLRKCDPVISLTAELTCLNSTNSPIPCGESLPHGTTVTAVCKPQHFPRDGRLRKLTCNQGNWDYPAPRCDPECGLEKSQGLPYVIGGFKVKRGGFPWHVGIFDQHDVEQPPAQICGGTIVANNKIITAAHCFFNTDTQRIEEARHYWIAAGKLYRDFNHPNDSAISYVQKSKIKQIHVPSFYGGDEQNQQNDIAVLILETPLLFSDSVHAACLDLNNNDFDNSQTAPGKTGKVSGWGLTSEGGQASEILKAIVVPVIDYNTCRNDMPVTFRRYLTTDKLCAGYKDNGTSLCQGDSGGGFVVSTQVWEVERWYLRGVVSVGPLNDEMDSCRSNSYTAFTHLFKLSSWILDIITE